MHDGLAIWLDFSLNYSIYQGVKHVDGPQG
jgi:hypothetical protein